MADPQLNAPVNSLLDLDDDALFRNRRLTFREDLSYRDNEYDIDFDAASELYEAKSTDTDEDGIPRVNLIRRAVEDHVSVAMANIPKARLIPERNSIVMGGESNMASTARNMSLDIAESTFNGMVDAILIDNDYIDLAELAVRQAAVYGVGYLKVEIDRTADMRKSLELRDLFHRGPQNWNELDAMRFDALTRRVDIAHVNTPAVVWQGGVRRVGPDMLRVHIVEHKNTQALRAIYRDKDIMVGRSDFTVDDDIVDNDASTAVCTTWELVPEVKTKTIAEFYEEDMPDMPGEMDVPAFIQPIVGVTVTEWSVLKTVCGGGKLLEREQWSSEEGPVTLPIIPWYMRESEKHPYGYAIPQALELSERFINRVRTLIYQSALKSISPQAVIGLVSELADDDAEAINAVLSTGGFANIKGNDYNGQVKIQEIIQPIITNNPGVSNALVQAMQNEEAAFQLQSASIDLNQIARAESGAAKRAQIAAFDRPKTITVNLLSRSVEMLYDSIWEIIRTKYRSENMPITTIGGSGQRESAVLNTPYERTIPMIGEDNQPVRDERGGIMSEEIKLILNDTTISMKAEAEGRGKLPLDMVQKFMILREFRADGLIKSAETMREMVLDPATRSKDDANYAKDLKNMQQLAREQAGATGGDTGEQSVSIDNLSGAPPAPGGVTSELSTSESPQDISMAPTMDELLGDAAS